jgi:ribosome-binding protein aMBF1 (putative translation factor)
MPKSSPSSVPSPRFSDGDSSAGPSSSKRAKYLGRGSHALNLREAGRRTSTGRCDSTGNKQSRGEHDSANFKAAQMLMQKRRDAGLTQEELAFLSGESPKQIGQRERGEVKLGALRALIILERAAGLKATKGSK